MARVSGDPEEVVVLSGYGIFVADSFATGAMCQPWYALDLFYCSDCISCRILYHHLIVL